MNRSYGVLLLRSSIFLLLIFGVLPFLFATFSNGRNSAQEYRFYSFGAYVFILLVFFFIFHREKFRGKMLSVSIVERLIFIGAAVISFTTSFYLRYFVEVDYFSVGLFFGSTVFFLLGSFAIACTVFSFRFFTDKYRSLFILSALTYFFYIITQLLWQFWEFLAFRVAMFVKFILDPFYIVSLTLDVDPTLQVNGFSVIIGPPCSGIESLSMYLGLFALLIVYDHENLDLRRSAIVFVLGEVLVYLLNIVRVSLIMIIGVRNADLAVGMFHSNAGWVMFSVMMLGLIYFGYPWMRKVSKVEKRKYKSMKNL